MKRRCTKAKQDYLMTVVCSCMQFYGVYLTNSFGANPDKSGRRHHIFPTVSRVNHSCLPTCIVDFEADKAVSMRHVSLRTLLQIDLRAGSSRTTGVRVLYSCMWR